VVRIRRFEERVQKVFRKGRIPGIVHLYIGQEAVAAGVCANLRDDDYITSTHRGHGHCVAKGAAFDRMLAELYGRLDGLCKGKGGSMHVADFERGILGACGIVGGGIPIATGAGLAAKLSGSDRVAVSFFSDGASNEGTFHESLNLAAVWKLPVVYVCENNLYAEFHPASRTTSVVDIADRAHGYGIPGEVVDGMDPAAVYEAAGRAVKRAREGLGPTLMECKTYRFEGHSDGEQAYLGGQTYRSEDEVAEWRERDPLDAIVQLGLQTGCFTQDDLARLEEETRLELDAAVAFAEASPEPTAEDARLHVFSD
jgi:TPP-dependent pyruvate/acetoin dehydrogenase alpha subunit